MNWILIIFLLNPYGGGAHLVQIKFLSYESCTEAQEQVIRSVDPVKMRISAVCVRY